jgi:hypothetical protein
MILQYLAKAQHGSCIAWMGLLIQNTKTISSCYPGMHAAVPRFQERPSPPLQKDIAGRPTKLLQDLNSISTRLGGFLFLTTAPHPFLRTLVVGFKMHCSESNPAQSNFSFVYVQQSPSSDTFHLS